MRRECGHSHTSELRRNANAECRVPNQAKANHAACIAQRPHTCGCGLAEGRDVGELVEGRSVGGLVEGKSVGESVEGRNVGENVEGRTVGEFVFCTASTAAVHTRLE